MKISKNIKTIINEFNLNLPIDTISTNKIDMVNKTLYNDIHLSYKYIKLLIKKGALNIDIKETSPQNKLPYTELMSSKYIPKEIKDEINVVNKGFIEYNIKIYDTNVTLLMMLEESDFNNLNKYDKMILDALVWIKIGLIYSKNKTKNIKIYLYLTKQKKMIPKIELSVLNSKNCNTAITTACNPNGEILIFRKEEWFKVLIHETFHLLCLDFSGLNYSNLRLKFKKIFNLDSEYEMSESYSEFWANYINTLFYSYDLLDNKNNFNDFLLYTKFCVEYEKKFALFQMVKILDFMNLTYNELLNNSTEINLKKRLYKEDTNVFAYYMVKSILLFNYEDFILWCYNNNDNILSFKKMNSNLNSFFLFFKKHYKNDILLKKIKEMEKFYSNVDKNSYLYNTLRMTIFT